MFKLLFTFSILIFFSCTPFITKDLDNLANEEFKKARKALDSHKPGLAIKHIRKYEKLNVARFRNRAFCGNVWAITDLSPKLLYGLYYSELGQVDSSLSLLMPYVTPTFPDFHDAAIITAKIISEHFQANFIKAEFESLDQKTELSYMGNERRCFLTLFDHRIQLSEWTFWYKDVRTLSTEEIKKLYLDEFKASTFYKECLRYVN